MANPVTIVASGGVPVVDVTPLAGTALNTVTSYGVPCTPTTGARPVTIVASGAPPVVFIDTDGVTFMRGGSSLLTAPTLSWTSGTTDNTPDLTVTFPDILVTGTDVTFEYANNSSFTGATSVLHDLTDPESLAQAMSLSLSALTDGTWYIRVKYAGSAWSNTETKTIDAPPTLTSPTATATGTTTATIGVTTDQANGTLYYVMTTSATPPSAAQVKAGQNNGGTAAAFSGNQAISTTGAKTANATGLSSGTTYYTYFMHEDAGANQSTVAAASSITTTTSIPALTYVGTTTGPSGNGTVTRTWTGVDIGNPAYIATRRVYAFCLGGTITRTLSSATINGVSATTTQTAAITAGGQVITVASAVVTSGTTGVTVAFTFSDTDFSASHLGIFTVDNSLLSSPTLTIGHASATSTTTISTSVAVPANGFLVLGRTGNTGSGQSLTTDDAGLTVDFNATPRMFAHKNSLAAATYNEGLTWTTNADSGLALFAGR